MATNTSQESLENKALLLESLLVEEITIGSDVLDRSYFYEITMGMSDELLNSIKSNVKKRVETENRQYDDNNFIRRSPEELAKERRLVEGQLHGWFRPWTRLAGRIDHEVESMTTSVNGTGIDEKAFSEVCLKFRDLPEYQPFLDREFAGYIVNRCKEFKLDYTRLPESLKTLDLEVKFMNDFPYLMESKEWEILSLAYEMGSPRVVILKEEPSPMNGYIGGEIKFSRYLDIRKDIYTNEGKITALGYLDFKDCTNVYAIIENGLKAISIHELRPYVGRSILEYVHDINKYRQDQNLTREERRRMLRERNEKKFLGTFSSLGTVKNEKQGINRGR